MWGNGKHEIAARRDMFATPGNGLSAFIALKRDVLALGYDSVIRIR
jgi:hypothetical protein